MNGILLSFAELHHLLAADEVTRRRLQLAAPTSEIQASGFSGLAARGLVAPAGEEAQVDPRLEALITALTTTETWVEIGFARPDQASGIQIFDGSNGRAAAVARPFGTFLVREMPNDGPLEKGIVNHARGYLTEPPAAVFVKRERSGAGPAQFAVRSRSLGRVEVADTPDTEATTLRELSLDEACAELAGFLANVA